MIIGIAVRIWRRRDGGTGAVDRPSRAPSPVPVPAFVAPSDLPPPPDVLFGRDEPIARMRAALRRRPDHRSGVIAIHGEAGIGKTALATRFAYLVADEFPDGRLFGSGTQGSAGILAGFVEALRGNDDPGPSSEVDTHDQYAALTRDRRVLVIIDDAEHIDRLSAVLPAGAGCVAVVTSRRPIPGVECDLEVELSPLPELASVDLLISMIGAERVDRAREAAHAIAGYAGHHPLALRLIGTALSRRPHWDLDLVARRMAEGLTSGVRTPFSGGLNLSYALLTVDERRALCLLGLLDDEDAATFAPWMLAALLGQEEDIAWRITDRLVEAGLIVRRSTDTSGVATFRVLDHAHHYARARLAAETSDLERRQSQDSLRRVRVKRSSRSAESDLDDKLYLLKDRGELNKAMDVTRAALALAREHGNRSAESLALATLAELNAELGSIADATEQVDAALAFQEPRGIVRALRCRALISRRQHRISEALDHLDRALTALAALDPEADGVLGERIRLLRDRAAVHAFDRTRPMSGLADLQRVEQLLVPHRERARLLRPSLCWVRGLTLDLADHHDEAAAVLAEGQRLADELGQRWWQAWLAHAKARLALETGDLASCRSEADQAIDLLAAMHHRYGTAQSRLLLGKAYLRDQRVDAAATALEEAIETVRRCGDPHLEALTLKELAEVRLAQYRSTGAAERLAEAVAMLHSAVGTLHRLRDTDEAMLVQMRLDEVEELVATADTAAGVRDSLW